MVDMATYNLMHNNDEPIPERAELDEEAMLAKDPPDDAFALLLPATIKGFGFHNKKWST